MELAILVVVVSAVSSCFFALHGFILRSLNKARLVGVFEGWRGTRRLAWIDAHYKEICLTVFLLRAMSNLFLVIAMVYYFCGDGLAWTGMLKALGVSAGIIAVFGVAVPFAWVAYAGKKLLSVTFPLIVGSRYACYPLTRVMMVFDTLARRLSGWQESQDENAEAMDEIFQAVEEGRAEGAVNASEVKMIESIMELSRVDTAEIMTPRTDIFALEAESDFSRAVREIRSAGHSRVPVYRENMDNIVGVVYAKDLLGLPPDDDAAGIGAMLREPFFVPETKSIESLLREFKLRKVHLAIVLDEYGGTAGLVTIEDVLEEIVGEIADEYDKAEVPRVRRINESTVDVDGRMRIDEINDLLDIALPLEEDYDTVAGYAIAQFGYIPGVDEKFTSCGVEFTVLQADDRRIQSLRITRRGEGELP